MPDAPELEEERAFLLQSLRDLDAERDAGDLSDADYRVLHDRYTVRAATVLRALQDDAEPKASGESVAEDSSPAEPASPTTRRRRARFLWAGLGLFAVAAVVLLVSELAIRLPGQTPTGSVRLSSAQQIQQTLDQAVSLETSGDAARALRLYREVLQSDPTQEQALAESGWLEYEAGVTARNATLLSTGQRDEETAERVDPSAYAPHLYLGSMLLVERRSSDAADEFDRFLAASPPTEVVSRAWPYVVRADTESGRPVPPTPPGVNG